MTEDVEFSEESLRAIASQKVSFRYSVKIHAITYILVNILLITINAIFITDIFLLSNWWAIYPALGWLIGLMIHISAYVLYSQGTSNVMRGIVLHIVAYIFTTLFLVIIDFITTMTLDWAFYPTLFWGLGILGHLIISALVTKEKTPKVEEKPSKKERAIEKELEKIRRKMKSE
ncbi:MAG TPA: 2TM domain-containing protein [Candidatus Deferrimicrobium sp.]|nr:2TM domain-containing protein [Candidatus Deferrimicrobium sp.]